MSKSKAKAVAAGLAGTTEGPSRDHKSRSKRQKMTSAVVESSMDQGLASLFAHSAGPVKVPATLRQLKTDTIDASRLGKSSNTWNGAESQTDRTPSSSNAEQRLEDESPLNNARNLDRDVVVSDIFTEKKSRKRKGRIDDNDELEDNYMRRLAADEPIGVARRKDHRLHASQAIDEIRARPLSGHAESISGDGNDDAGEEWDKREEEEEEEEEYQGDPVEAADQLGSLPQHESLQMTEEATELDKSSRTVFLSNVSTLAITSKKAKKELSNHLSSFLDSLNPASSDTSPHRIESLRFRSTAFSSTFIPKKAAFVKKELMDATTGSTNAYVVYTTSLAAREASKRLNGSVVLDRHLRADSVAHPAKTDHRRCVFVGNLDFVNDELLEGNGEGSDEPKKRSRNKQPADIEEGLWRQFSKAGEVESVRVIRDAKTRVGKGIAYVQFKDPNAVEAALLYNEKRFPPLLPRKLRVTRAKNIKRTSALPNAYRSTTAREGSRVYVPKLDVERQTLHGRAGKLLGRAGAAKLRPSDSETNRSGGVGKRGSNVVGIAKTPEMVVFEGFRASSKTGKSGLKLGGSGKRKGKPRSRSSKRGSAWKAAGMKKVGK